MRKYLIIIAVIIMILCFYKNEEVIIPDNSIRFRVIANSNSIKDQKVKKEIVKSLNNEIERITSNSNNIEEARINIKKDIPSIYKQIDNTKANLKYTKSIDVKYGNNYFPKKTYKGVTYNEGEYESLVITIGDGIGKNFWCVLFPPLCNIDETREDVEYVSLIKEILNKYKK